MRRDRDLPTGEKSGCGDKRASPREHLVEKDSPWSPVFIMYTKLLDLELKISSLKTILNEHALGKQAFNRNYYAVRTYCIHISNEFNLLQPSQQSTINTGHWFYITLGSNLSFYQNST